MASQVSNQQLTGNDILTKFTTGGNEIVCHDANVFTMIQEPSVDSTTIGNSNNSVPSVKPTQHGIKVNVFPSKRSEFTEWKAIQDSVLRPATFHGVFSDGQGRLTAPLDLDSLSQFDGLVHCIIPNGISTVTASQVIPDKDFPASWGGDPKEWFLAAGIAITPANSYKWATLSSQAKLFFTRDGTKARSLGEELWNDLNETQQDTLTS
jgi:hypothetical protein